MDPYRTSGTRDEDQTLGTLTLTSTDTEFAYGIDLGEGGQIALIDHMPSITFAVQTKAIASTDKVTVTLKFGSTKGAGTSTLTYIVQGVDMAIGASFRVPFPKEAVDRYVSASAKIEAVSSSGTATSGAALMGYFTRD